MSRRASRQEVIAHLRAARALSKVDMRIDATGHDKHTIRVDDLTRAATERADSHDFAAGHGDISLGHIMRRDDRTATYQEIVVHLACFSV